MKETGQFLLLNVLSALGTYHYPPAGNLTVCCVHRLCHQQICVQHMLETSLMSTLQHTRFVSIGYNEC